MAVDDADSVAWRAACPQSEDAGPSKSVRATTKESILKTMTTFIKRHPVLTFYTLAFAISWGGILFLVGGPGRYPGTPEQVARLFLVVMLAWLAGPIVASLLMTGLVSGRAGLRELLSRLLKWRLGARWYALALLTAPLV
jgi:hypothetical protein